MAIASSDKLVVVKAFAMGNPLPLDAREIYESLADAQKYAKSSAVAYAGQTIKVVEEDAVTVYTLVPSSTEGTNYDLQFVGGGGSGVQNVGTSATEGNIAVTVVDGDSFKDVNVPVVGALVNPVVDEDAHTLTLTKIGATANEEVVIPLGGASPSSIVSKVEIAADGTSVTVTSFDVEAETESSETISLKNVVTAVTHTDATETSSAKTEVSYKDADGAAQKLTMFETGVQKVVAGSTTNKLAVTVAGTDGALTTTEIQIGTGSVLNPTYESDGRVITLPVLQADGTTTDLVIDLGKDMVVKSGTYNTETQELELTLTDNSVVKIPAASLVDVYTGESTDTAVVAVSADNKITAQVKISTVEGNLVKSDENGLYVVESDFVATQKLITDAEAAAKEYADEQVAAAKTELEEADATNLAAAKTYADEQVAAEKAAREAADTTNLQSAKDYADEQVAAAKTELEEADATNLAAAKTYADEQVAAEKAAREAADTANLTEAKTYTDAKVAEEATARSEAITNAVSDVEDHVNEQVAAEKAAREAADTQTLTDAKTYADEQIATKIEENNEAAVADALAQAKAYTDEKVAAEVTARDEAIATAKTALGEADATNLAAAKTYAEEQVATAKTALEEADATNLAAAKTYAEEQVATAQEALEEADATNLAAAKAYTDEKISASSTSWVDFGSTEA